jgi:hypothetical protein
MTVFSQAEVDLNVTLGGGHRGLRANKDSRNLTWGFVLDVCSRLTDSGSRLPKMSLMRLHQANDPRNSPTAD